MPCIFDNIYRKKSSDPIIDKICWQRQNQVKALLSTTDIFKGDELRTFTSCFSYFLVCCNLFVLVQLTILSISYTFCNSLYIKREQSQNSFVVPKLYYFYFQDTTHHHGWGKGWVALVTYRTEECLYAKNKISPVSCLPSDPHYSPRS